jgi:hypothetical protein
MSSLFAPEEIRQKINLLAKKIDAPKDLLPAFSFSERAEGQLSIEVDDLNYHLRAWDRDLLTINRQTPEIDELLYWVFELITFDMASNYEVNHRDEKIDFRRKLFSYQLSLLEKLSPKWKGICQANISEILRNHPYNDLD